MKSSVKYRYFALFLSVSVLFSPFLHASTNWEPMATITASDAAASDLFGTSVDIDGEYAIIGAYKSDSAGTDSGSAYIYKYDSTTEAWTRQAKLTPSDPAANDRFGFSVSISGDHAIIGAPYKGSTGTGAAYIFARSGTQWSQVKKLTPHDGADYDRFGTSVSISGNYAVVGSPRSDTGSAYLWLKDSSWQYRAKLTASDGASGDEFGTSVSISGNFAIIGAYGNDEYGSNSGAAYIFDLTNDLQPVQQKLTLPDAAANSLSGYSVAITNGYAVIGSLIHNGTGAVDIFKYENSTWTHDSAIVASDIAAGDNFGCAVSIDSVPSVYTPRLIVGSKNNDSGASGSGAAYIFENKDSSWQQLNKLTSSTPAEYDYFGTSVSISGNLAIAGIPNYDDPQTDSGAACIFERIYECPTADLSGDCFVDLADFAIVASQWLTGEKIN